MRLSSKPLFRNRRIIAAFLALCFNFIWFMPVLASGPAISYFTSDQTSITLGGSAILTWVTTDATAVSLYGPYNQGTTPPVCAGLPVALNGSQSVSPTVTSLYYLCAGDAVGNIQTATVSVTVTTGAPVINSFTALPMTIAPGQSASLSWQTTGADTVKLFTGTNPNPANCIGQGVNPSAVTTLFPAATTQYTLYAINAVNCTSATVTVTVAGSALPSINTFTADKTTISSNQSAILSWTTTNATAVQLYGPYASNQIPPNCIGAPLGLNGSQDVTPTVTGTYILFASNSAGCSTKTITITVGSLVGSPIVTNVKDGDLILDSGTIYIIEYGKKRGFTSLDAFNRLGYNFKNVTTSDLSQVPVGDPVTSTQTRHPRGTLVINQGVIYFLGTDLRYGFPSGTVFLSWGNKFSNAAVANTYDMALPEGPVAQMKQ